MPKLLAGLALALVFTAGGCKSEKVVGPTGVNRVLFIGNSYLFTQNIPEAVESLAKSQGLEMTAEMVAGPDMALYDHLERGDAVNAMILGGWSHIVLQQGPSSVSYNRDSLRAVAVIYDGIAKQVNAKTAWFSAWPQQQHFSTFPRAIESYRLAAEDVGGLYMPVAAAWLKAWELDPSLQLYSDGLHPSAEGAYLAAIVVYSALFQRTPVGLPPDADRLHLDIATATLLQSAAAQVMGYAPQ